MTEAFRTEPRRSDVAAIDRVVRATGVFSEAEIAIANELVEDRLARGDKSPYQFLFADAPDGSLAGYVCFGPLEGTVRRHMLYWIAVDPNGMRNGLARRLHDATEAGARALGATVLIAETSTRPDYAAARAFYIAMGYTKIAELADWHDEGDGMAIFWKRL